MLGKGKIRTAFLLLTAFLFALSYPALAHEEQEAAKSGKTASWFEKISVNGFVSVAYLYNFNKPESGANQFRVFDFDDSSFKPDVVELVIQKAPDDAGDVGFRVDFMAGASVPRVIASYGMFRNADGAGEDFDVQQAYISYMAPLGNGLRFDFGKHITHTGAEVIEGYDGFNDNYSRSLLFGYAIPFTHTGLKGTYSFNDKVTAMFLIANGWDNVKDNNRNKSIGAQLSLLPVQGVTLVVDYMGGAERNDSGDWRNLLDLVAIWRPTDNVAVTLNYDYGRETNGAGQGEDATWSGIAGYVRFGIRKDLALAFRAESFKDKDGVRTGVAQTLSEFTITPEVRMTDQFLIRGDLRFDHSDRDVFDDNGEPGDNQATISFNAIYLF